MEHILRFRILLSLSLWMCCIVPAVASDTVIHAGTLIDAIEHGSFATPEAFSLVKKHGTYLVPALTVFEIYYVVGCDHPELLPPGTASKELANDLLPKRNLPAAIDSRVKIAYGADIGEGDHTMEFKSMIANGMKSIEAIWAATRNAADLLGVAGRLGSIEASRLADIVAVERYPIGDPETLRHVVFVMKGGVVYRQGGHAPNVAGTDGARMVKHGISEPPIAFAARGVDTD
jgi:imidazolonepropionase-like amidohydrolase